MAPATRPTSVVISILNSDAYANYPPMLDGGAAHTGAARNEPYVGAIKDA